MKIYKFPNNVWKLVDLLSIHFDHCASYPTEGQLDNSRNDVNDIILTFDGEIDVGMTWEEWDRLSARLNSQPRHQMPKPHVTKIS